ncbi:MAG: PAS-domain containing protein [Pseudomonadota bacterium]
MSSLPSTTSSTSSGGHTLGAVLEQLSDGILVVGSDRRIVAFNQRYAEMYNLAADDVSVGDRVEDLLERVGARGGFPVEPAALVEEIAARIAAWGSDAARFERRRFPDGRVIDITRQRTAEGSIVAVHKDMSARIADQVALERNHASMRSILDNITDGVVLLDEAGYVIAFNDRLLALYDIPPERARWGMHFREMARHFGDLARLTPERRQMEIERRYAFATDPMQQNVQRQLFTGATLEIHKAQLPFGGCVLTIRDVSKQIRQGRMLEEERRRVEESSRQKSRFLARMSHEMRTPLNGILGIAALLETTDLDPKQRTYSGVIRDSGAVLLRLIDDLLDTARIESESFELREAPFSPAAVLREALATIEPEAATKGIELRSFKEGMRTPPLLGDAVRLKQIVLNLLTNAVKFTEAGHVLLDLDARLGADHAGLVISVKDTGIGIASDEIERVFSQFYQADGKGRRNGDGVGLGLAISDRLVRQMGGRIAVTSTLGEGTTFKVHLTLPFAPQASA